MNCLVGTEKTSAEGKLAISSVQNERIGFTVNFLQSELLGLTDEAEYHEPCYQVETSVEANCGAGVSRMQ